MAEGCPFNQVEELPRISVWRMICEWFRDIKSTWKLQLLDCPTSWKCIRSAVTWCCFLLGVNAIYWLFGGLLFASLEGWHESRYKCGALRIRRHFIEELWEQSSILPEDEWRSLARQRLVDFEDQLHEAFGAGLNSYSGKRTWGFWDAVAFSMTTVATIGYGHIVPVTWLGRLSIIGYSIFGIPLFLMLLADCGLLLTRFIKFYWVFLLRFSSTSSGKRFLTCRLVQFSKNTCYTSFDKLMQRFETKRWIGPAFQLSRRYLNEGFNQLQTTGAFSIDDQFDIPAIVSLVLLAIYLFIGTIIFYVSEEWSPLESFYFVYISLTTIGYGDYIPQHPLAILTSVVYIIFGLALTGLCLNAVQAELLQRSERARTKLCSMLGLHLNGCEIVELEQISSSPVTELSEEKKDK